MAKGFPYFKFMAADWLTGDIVFEDFELQGIFINICALYWHRDGNLTIIDIEKRLKTDRFYSLLDRFISVSKDGKINIKFLDEQLQISGHISRKNSENGKLGGRPKAAKTLEEKPTALRSLSDRKAKKSKEEEESEEDKRVKNKNINIQDIPNLDDFLNYAKNELKADFSAFEFAVKAKYQAWVDNGWKDGYNKPIRNWKSKLLNTIPHLRPNYQKLNQNQQQITKPENLTWGQK